MVLDYGGQAAVAMLPASDEDPLCKEVKEPYSKPMQWELTDLSSWLPVDIP
jgi:hypothetical protein